MSSAGCQPFGPARRDHALAGSAGALVCCARAWGGGQVWNVLRLRASTPHKHTHMAGGTSPGAAPVVGIAYGIAGGGWGSSSAVGGAVGEQQERGPCGHAKVRIESSEGEQQLGAVRGSGGAVAGLGRSFGCT